HKSANNVSGEIRKSEIGRLGGFDGSLAGLGKPVADRLQRNEQSGRGASGVVEAGVNGCE
ncbi:hypothetical protein, partial [Candidatus Accumulibacter vicinus]|uniref:hypothetical protein n=1 Tax=Candidatus Accumulibacter vicinus TaxID=2954382 RepID=UPI00235B63A0